MIPVSRLRVLADAGYTAAYDFVGGLKSALPSDGVVLSGEEVAQIREALKDGYRRSFGDGLAHTRLDAALSLLDSAGEER